MIQIDEEFLINMVMTNLKNWKDLFRNIRQDFDFDKNGFLSKEEMQEMFETYYPD